jgi:2-polyprenyl-6-hydroxyphenyl methylase/3-demethylubiquinone-9 3-methyltransferase
MVFNPLSWGWSLSHRDMSVNYAATALQFLYVNREP